MHNNKIHFVTHIIINKEIKIIINYWEIFYLNDDQFIVHNKN